MSKPHVRYERKQSRYNGKPTGPHDLHVYSCTGVFPNGIKEIRAYNIDRAKASAGFLQLFNSVLAP